MWEWKQKYGTRISEQIRCLGASVDWERETFTMDAKLSTAVTEAFVRFQERGLVYRDKRLVRRERERRVDSLVTFYDLLAPMLCNEVLHVSCRR